MFNEKINDSSRSLFHKILLSQLQSKQLVLIDNYLENCKKLPPPPQSVVVFINNPKFYRMVLTKGSLGLGEAYMLRYFEAKHDNLAAFTTLLLKAKLDKKIKSNFGFMWHYAGVLFSNYFKPDHVNVRSHYDIGDELFESFLQDEFMVYSCGYAGKWDDDINTLQKNKLDRICKKLDLQSNDKLLDIGCGNGGLLIYAALNYGINGTGYSNSKNHSEKARACVKKYGLENRITIHTADFEDIEGEYQKVVSVGMLEHVKPNRYKKYFLKIANLLTEDGKALIHAIGANSSDRSHDPFIQKYIFPGSYTPALSDFTKHIEKNDMAIIDVENIVRHYAVTTQRWLEAFDENKDKLPADRYDESFKRMWRFYLSIGVSASLASQLGVFQVLFNKKYDSEQLFQRV